MSLLHTTSLAHEAWIKLLRKRPASGVPHFGTVVAIMRSIIIDEARSGGAAKRGKGWRRISLVDLDTSSGATERTLDVLDVEEGLLNLERSHPRAAHVLELRVFGGLGTSQTAALMRISDRTVEAELRFARAMLRARVDPL